MHKLKLKLIKIKIEIKINLNARKILIKIMNYHILYIGIE